MRKDPWYLAILVCLVPSQSCLDHGGPCLASTMVASAVSNWILRWGTTPRTHCTFGSLTTSCHPSSRRWCGWVCLETGHPYDFFIGGYQIAKRAHVSWRLRRLDVRFASSCFPVGFLERYSSKNFAGRSKIYDRLSWSELSPTQRLKVLGSFTFLVPSLMPKWTFSPLTCS